MEQLEWLLLYKELQTKKIKSSLHLQGLKIPSWFRFSNNLEIDGILDLSYSNISKLPKNLHCQNLWLTGCKNLKELPEGLKVEATISLRGSSIEQLPKNLQCRNLWLDRCKNIKELSNGLWVKDLVIRNSSLTKEYCVQMKQEGKISYQILYD